VKLLTLLVTLLVGAALVGCSSSSKPAANDKEVRALRAEVVSLRKSQLALARSLLQLQIAEARKPTHAMTERELRMLHADVISLAQQVFCRGVKTCSVPCSLVSSYCSPSP
jgi:hypothetical protein